MSETKRPDPTALGLFGLAMVTLVASSEKLGLTSGYSYLLPWAIFLGAIAQLIAGILDYQKNNVFGGTAFCAYGLFWLGIASSWLMSMGALGPELQVFDPKQLGVAYIGYLIFTIFMTIAATETNKVLFFIFLFIDFLFIGLAFSTLGIAPDLFKKVAAISELIIALLSFYGSAGNIFINHFGKELIPIGKPFGIFK